MTTESVQAVPRLAADDVPVGSVSTRTLAAEWARLWTVRSTWWFLAAAAVATIGLGLVAGSSADPAESQGDAAWAVSAISAMPAQFALLALAVTAVAADYATGGIVLTLQWTPRRGVLFAARTIVVVVTTTVVAVVLGFLSALAGYLAASPTLRLPVGEGVDTLGTVAFVLAASSALAVGLGFLLRSVAAALVTVFLLILVLPLFLLAAGQPWMVDVASFLPGSGTAFLLLGGGPPGMSTEAAFAVLGAWGVGGLAAGWVRLARDDAAR
ncbi:hypothetical protein [Cellulomonas aerilata]|uniref:ABC transporter n=1 Tax=Cellulomonas aerilata TaxID=515326 RepID=A0A512DA10_9CELL|nr:hypothetical protein [Cellulomonas aerilata]GEO33313.1 ABC transporter [Cellulomonas aerilata]